MKRDLEGWEAHLSQSEIPVECGAAEAALASMAQNVAARLDTCERKADDRIPEEVLGQMRACQTAANSFLRQIWSADYPPAGGETQTLGGPICTTLAQWTAKATRIMARCLTQTPEKVAAVISVAETAGADRGWVQIACLLFVFGGRRADDGVFRVCSRRWIR